ncbi:hypothetical protein GIB67_035501 [Kingdonia uniflora]|uniref:very-long-chain 3-oxoacyl-CoA synthase n=1 Tax=Kingdonia uniflora TaxID=39325 RepID=A0A7J7MC13_9MAGN|nr:hypothetical protein GIB67_035501 [Kingdonia uniflora]
MPLTLHQLPPDASLGASLEEIEVVLFTMVGDLITKNKISPKSIDILTINCSAFCPIPSITAMIINKFGFRSNVMSFNLTGMGCSAGLLSISLARDLLKVHNNSLALVLSLECLTHNGYSGQVKSMLLTNTLFRMGGSAVLLSNQRRDKHKAKYTLQHLVRTNMSYDDQAYRCVFQEPDDDCFVGVSLSRKLLKVAPYALRINMGSLGPLVLPYSEQFRYVWSNICQKIWPQTLPKGKGRYIPDFKKAFKHFCIHAGGRAVIDAVENNLDLCEEDIEPSRMTLYQFGNTSSSSIWYSLCYLEAKGRVKKGDRVWQISLGSGFKCNSAVWKCVRDLNPGVKSAWSDCIHRYPIEVPDIILN